MLGMPYEDTASELEANQILARRTEIQEGCVPDFTQLITCGVDVQKNNLYYTVRAWGFGVISRIYSTVLLKILMNLRN